MKRYKWQSGTVGGALAVTAIVGLMSSAFGSVPHHVTNDTALYQNLSEIRAGKTRDVNFDQDIARLASSENHYRERLPVSSRERVQVPMSRIAKQRYHYSSRQK
jgi:hypothetical protein